MSRKHKTPPTPETAVADAAPVQPVEAAPDVQPPAAKEAPSAAEAAPAPTPLYLDPRPLLSVSLSDVKGGPAMHLLRSHRFNQMQIRFDGQQQPDEQYLAMLKRAGWRDRTEEEGVWTKQIDRNARWQSVDKMEREFKDVANAIRRNKGLDLAMQGLAVA